MACCLLDELVIFLVLFNVRWYVSATPAEYQVSNNCQLPLPSCANLSYYAEHSIQFFTNGAVFYFSEDTHYLNQILNITGVNNLTLQGLGGREVGFHETVTQSKSIVSCANSNTGGIIIRYSSHIVIKNLSITKCGFRYDANANISLFVNVVRSFTLQQVSVLNSTGVGVVLSNAFNVSISDSSFAFSKMLHYSNRVCFSNVVIVSMVTEDPAPSYFTIVRSNFSFGFCYVGSNTFFGLNGTGLSITLSQMGFNNGYATHFDLDSLVFHGNTAPNGANFNFAVVSQRGNYTLALSNIRSVYANTIVTPITSGGCGFRISQDNVIKGKINIKNSEIAYNDAKVGGTGGVLIYMKGSSFGVTIELDNCNIHNNIGVNTSGVSITKQFGLSTDFAVTFKNVSIHNNAIMPHNNLFYTAAVHLYNVAVVMFYGINISNHMTMGIYSYKSYIYFRYDNNYFVNNSGLSGGAMGLYQSYLTMNGGTRVNLYNNHAQYFGGALFLSQASNNIPVPCFYGCIYIGERPYPAVIFHFFNNSAGVAGDAIYGISSIQGCGWVCDSSFDEIFNVTLQNNGLSIMSSDPLQVCFCEPNEPPNCGNKQTTQKVIPGSSINISVAAVGFKNGLTTGAIKVTEYSNSKSNKQITTFGITASCTNITYTFDILNSSITSLLLYITLENSFNPFNDKLSNIISITVEPCPNGFQLSSINGKCICRSELNDVQGISCDDDSKMISKEYGNVWIGFDNNSDCLITYQPCPFDYCKLGNVAFNLTDPSPQCALNRAGLLCGQCADGLSLMLGTNQCGECTNDYFSLIVVFALAGVALVVFLIALNLTVSVGTINSVIFYANIVKLYEPLFFPKGPVIILSQFISWINLDLGIQTCFLQNMNSCSKTGLQFVFPFFIWLIIIVIIVMARYSTKIARLIGTNIISVLATMILLSYTKLIRAVITSLYIADISCSTQDNEETIVTKVWYVDSSIQYLQGCHFLLFTVSVVVLCFIIFPFTVYLLLIPIIEKYSMYCKKVTLFFKPFFDAYCGPYKDKYRFWTGFLLLVRVVLALVVSLAAESSSNVLVAVIIVILCMIFLLKGIYRTFSLVILDIFFLINLLMIAHLSTQMQFQSEAHSIAKFQIAIIVFVSFALIVFCSIISFHIWKCINQYEVMQKFTNSCKKKKAPSIVENNPDGTELNVKTYPTTVGCNINNEREPLLFSSNESKSASHNADLFN